MPSSLLVTSSDYNPPSAVAYADVPGLSISVVAGTTYAFEFGLLVSAAAATTGHAISVNGPASPTYLRYGWTIPLTATTTNYGGSNIYDHAVTPAASTSATAANPYLTTIKGVIVPSANGTFVCRVKPEVAAVMTVQRGSFGIVGSP